MPEGRAQLSYDSLLLCEDIRIEIDGKRTLVGVFTSDQINVPFLPFMFTFSVYAAGIVWTAGKFRAIGRVFDHDGNSLVENAATGTVDLRLGRFAQNLSFTVEIKESKPIKVALYDEDSEVGSIIYGITALSSPNMVGIPT